VVVTGASAGIGAATVRALAGKGHRVIAGARRLDRLAEVAEPVGATALKLDVADGESVERFVACLERVEVLVNNAGFVIGLDKIADADPDGWRRMFETNVLGALRMTRALLPLLLASGDGHVVNVVSTSGFETYPGGGGYTATKHALRAVTKTLRQELLGQPVRVTDVSPGLVETEFSMVRFAGDRERAKKVYEGMAPLAAEDVAEAIVWAIERPPHVNVDEIVLRPRDQASSTQIHRRKQ
jgi:NADP-dependent 3-hydroxy acid dehydrogenase YdfG